MSENVSVFVRCRPIKEDERRSSLQVVEDINQVKVSSRDYYFDQVFSHDSSQEEVYNAVIRPLINQVLNGYNCTVFAYGQTGTGKTYTMEGDRSADRVSSNGAGMVPRAVTQIFQALNSRGVEFKTKVSFIEIYSEEVYDLLSTTEDSNKLRIFDDSQKKGSVIIDGVKEIVVDAETDIFGILGQGATKRQTTSTLLNARSSRSHSVFSITITHGSTIGKLNLVDLAGSENIARSGAQDKHAREAGNINQSLLTLTRVITALVEKRSHVPYRESKLTRILQDSLGGSTRTSMIATISPAEADLNNTIGTLDYASRARCITNKLENNRPYLQKKSSEELNQVIQALREKHTSEIAELEFKIRNEVALEFRREMEKIKESINNQHREQMKESENRIVALNEEIDKLSDVNEELNKKLKIHVELCKYKDDLVKEIEQNLKAHLLENQELVREIKQLKSERSEHRTSESSLPESLTNHENVNNQEKQLQQQQQNHNEDPDEDHENHLERIEEVKKALKIRKRLPAQDDCNDYANMTFDGDDEIVQVSSKKTRRKVAVAGKKRDLYQAITLSGKKKRLKSTDEEAELSPISPPVRVTRSRATRRKLDY